MSPRYVPLLSAILCSLLSLGLVGVARAQELAPGRVVGRIVDARTGQGIANAGVQLVGTTQGVQSGLDGRFALQRVPAGTTTIQVRRIGYGAKTITGLMVPPGGVVEQDIALATAVAQIAATVVTADKERGSVAAALDQQRNATQIVNAITAEQIARSPDGDAAQAIQRVSGVTVQDGKYVFVRGLGERYTTASLNGARIPSPEPERKVVPLDLFPAGILQSVTTSKTFTPDQQGDFSGAQVDIKTREYPARRQFTYAVSTGFNDAATGQSVLRAARQGGEYFAAIGSKRDIPATLANTNLFSATTLQTNQVVRSLSNVWTPGVANGLPQGSVSASMGGSDPFFGQNIGYLVSASYGAAQEVKRDERQAYGQANGSGGVDPLASYRGETGRISVLWGGIANFSTLVGTSTRIALNNTLSRSADNEARRDVGFDENLADSLRRTTMRYVERGVWSSQLAVEQQFGRHKLDYALTGSGTNRREPDRSDMVQIVRTVGGVRQFQLLGSALDGARRSYFDLNERNLALQANDQVTVGQESDGNSIKVGGYYRNTTRASLAPSYSLINQGLSQTQLTQLPENIFTPANACDACTNFNVQPIGQAGGYDAKDALVAGYAMADWGLGKRVRLIAGARVEHAQIDVLTTTQGGSKYSASLKNTDVLPSLVVNTRLSDRQSLRVSATQTLARPEYRELSPVQFRDVIGGISVSGDPNLKRTLIQNVDVRWEFFPTAAEVFSVGVFYKNFTNPIERVEQPSSGGTTAKYINAAGAKNYGLELEARKDLGSLVEMFEGITAFSNVTIMQSTIDVGAATGGNASNPNRPMAGQAPYVVNAGLSYATLSGKTSATLLYNVVGRRIFSAGLLPLPDVYEEARNMVDVSIRFPIVKTLDVRLDAKNLLDAEYRVTQSNLLREGYRAGRVFAIGLGWRP